MIHQIVSPARFGTALTACAGFDPTAPSLHASQQQPFDMVITRGIIVAQIKQMFH